MNHRYHPETEKHHPSKRPLRAPLRPYCRSFCLPKSWRYSCERLLGEGKAPWKIHGGAEATFKRRRRRTAARGAAKGGGSLERKLPDPRTPSFGRCAVIC